jgi:putative FmdB family regulatory protein
MPIYEYRCTDCGFQDEYLQKASEALLTACPSCGRPTFHKLLSAAGFQLKGSGWYATDFKGAGKPAAAKAEAQDAAKPESKPEARPDAKPEPKGEAKAAPAKAPAAANSDS